MGKVLTLEEVEVAVEAARREGKKVVTTNGCFDILHVGHVRNLASAKALGDMLIVGINSDSSVKENKGDARPIVPAEERAEIIAALGSVDHVFIFEERTPHQWIRILRPDFHVKGGGNDVVASPEMPRQRKAVEDGGGQFVLVPHHEGRSTSSIIERIRSAG